MNTKSKLMSPILTEEEVRHLIQKITPVYDQLCPVHCLYCEPITKELKRILKGK